MRHVTITNFGAVLGVTGERLVIKENNSIIQEIPLSRLRTVTIAKQGISVSSNLIQACALRGIRLFFLDWRNMIISAVIGQNQHAVVALRRSQFRFIDSDHAIQTAAEIVHTKLHNQRAVLLYFWKYLKKSKSLIADRIRQTTELISTYMLSIKSIAWEKKHRWRDVLMGIEGISAKEYWQTLAETGMFPESFNGRDGRGATEVTNQCLNYGYALLMSYVWSALDNAGLEVFAGIYHVDRPGRPSLVLDLIEELRAWVVDRNIIRLSNRISQHKELGRELKTLIADSVHDTMKTPYLYRNKRLRLDSILQRQVYRLAGHISSPEGRYKGFHFRW